MEIKQINDQKQIQEILKIYNCDFIDSINNRVGNLNEYAIKITQYAQTYIAIENDKMLGCIIFYCNNFNERIAYIASISVSKEHRRKGIGAYMIDKCVDIAIKAGMIQLKLEVDNRNKAAIKLYTQKGFVFTQKSSENKVYMMKELR